MEESESLMSSENSSLASTEVDIYEKIPIKTLESPRFEKAPLLKEKQVGEIDGVPIYTYPQADFELSPNAKLGNRLNSIMDAKSSTEVFVRLAAIAGGTPKLWSLLTKGISTGLSGGTMDIIYRIGVGSKVHGLLDNLDIAVGSLQRRIQIGDIVAKTLNSKDAQRIVSIAGGSCLLPIEGIYQSDKYGVEIVNVDYSPKANQKADGILNMGKKKEDKGIGIRYMYSDILNDGIPDDIHSEKPQIFECTGFWEYLNPNDRDKLLDRVSEALKDTDSFILTALIDNPQEELFNKMGFKKLNPQDKENLVKQVKSKGLNIHKMYLTPNNTYATLVVSK